MDIKTVCVLFVALYIVSTEASTGTTSNVVSIPDVTSSDTSGVNVAHLRSKRQYYGYPGLGGGSNAFASANSFSGGGGLGGLGGLGGSYSGANANAGSSSFFG